MRKDQFLNALADPKFEDGDDVLIANSEDPDNPFPVGRMTKNRWGIIIHPEG